MATTDGPSVKQSVREERMRRHRDARIEHVRQRASHQEIINEFQSDAVEIEHRKVPGGARWTLYTVATLLVTAVLWSYWAKTDTIVIGQGKLITTENALVVQSFNAAAIRSLEVRFGDRVKAGQLVATLDTTFSEADLVQLNARKNAAAAASARMKAELDGTEFSMAGHENDREWKIQEILFRERQRNLNAEMEKFAAESTKISGTIKSTKEQVVIQGESIPALRERYNTQRGLSAKGRSSKTDLLTAKIGLDTATLQLATTKNRIQELQADLVYKDKEAASMVAGLRSQTAEQYATLIQELISIEQDINKATRMDELLELRVPTDSGHSEFVVFEVADRSVGSVLQNGEPLFKLIPIDVPLEVEVDISGKDVAKLRTLEAPPEEGEIPNGSKVKIKLSAFDYQDHGTLDGYVRAISEGVYQSEEQSRAPANYKARIKIVDPNALENVAKDFRLLPGMAATAEIKVGRRRVIHYILNPLLRYLDEGLREP